MKQKNKNDFKNIRSLKRASLLSVVSSLLWLPQAWCIAVAIGNLVIKSYNIPTFLLVAGVFIFGFLRTFLGALSARSSFCFARDTLSNERIKAIQVLASRSPVDIHKTSSGWAASVLAEQAEHIIGYLSRFQPARFRVMVVPFVIFLAVLPFSWAAGLALLFAMPLAPIFMALIGWRAKKASEEQLGKMGDMNAFLLDRLRGLMTIRSLDAVDITANRLRSSAELLKLKTMIVLRIAFLTSAVLELFSALGVAMVAVYIGFHLLGEVQFGAWGQQLTLTEGLFILLLAPAFFEPIRDLSAVWHDRASGEAAQEALMQLKDQGFPLLGIQETNIKIDHSSLDNQDNQNQFSLIAPAIEFRSVTFRYGEKHNLILNRFSCSIKSGEKIALLGPSGMGKSTILALISGLLQCQQGEILFNKTPLREDNINDIRAQISWLSQNSYIFGTTLKQNILLGRKQISDKQVHDALAVTVLDQVALKHHGQPIGESGKGLSGGETLRLALARAAAHPHATLILADEPTAHLDTETAQDITRGLLELSKNKTMIIATHDYALAQKMDRIIDMKALAKVAQ